MGLEARRLPIGSDAMTERGLPLPWVPRRILGVLTLPREGGHPSSRDYSSGQFVGIDLHRRRSVICRMSAEGEVLESVRIDNDRAALLREVSKAGFGAPVALEATYGWYWAVDTLQKHGFDVHLAHPKGLASFQDRRVKTDWADAKELVDLLRLGRFPEAYIAPVQLREVRELVRHRHKLGRVDTTRKPACAGARQVRRDPHPG